MRQEIIEEKLARLGVERGSGAPYLPSHPHGRAFSVSRHLSSPRHTLPRAAMARCGHVYAKLLF